MASLHLILSSAGFAACQTRIAEGDTMVLMQDGCYAHSHAPNAKVIASDADVRGLAQRCTIAQLIDYDGLVALTTTHQPIVTWK